MVADGCRYFPNRHWFPIVWTELVRAIFPSYSLLRSPHDRHTHTANYDVRCWATWSWNWSEESRSALGYIWLTFADNLQRNNFAVEEHDATRIRLESTRNCRYFWHWIYCQNWTLKVKSEIEFATSWIYMSSSLTTSTVLLCIGNRKWHDFTANGLVVGLLWTIYMNYIWSCFDVLQSPCVVNYNQKTLPRNVSPEALTDFWMSALSTTCR